MKTIKKIISEHIRYRRSVFRLAKSDLIKTYKGTALGWMWAVIRPAMTLAVYYFAFTVGLKVGREEGGYSFFLWLVSGVVPWFYMRDIITAGAGSIRKYRFLITKIKYPISTIPTFVSLSHLIVEVVLIGIVMILFVLQGHRPDIYWLQIPVYVLAMFVFFTIWALFSGILSTFSSDFLQLVKSSTIMLFWISGIMYNVGEIENEVIKSIMMLNPITLIVNGFRDSFIYKEWFWENPGEIVNFAAMLIIICCLATVCYNKMEREIADVL